MKFNTSKVNLIVGILGMVLIGGIIYSTLQPGRESGLTLEAEWKDLDDKTEHLISALEELISIDNSEAALTGHLTGLVKFSGDNNEISPYYMIFYAIDDKRIELIEKGYGNNIGYTSGYSLFFENGKFVKWERIYGKLDYNLKRSSPTTP